MHRLNYIMNEASHIYKVPTHFGKHLQDVVILFGPVYTGQTNNLLCSFGMQEFFLLLTLNELLHVKFLQKFLWNPCVSSEALTMLY